MMPRRKLLCMSMLAVCSLCFVTGPAFGQKVAKPQKKLMVFQLKYAVAEEAAGMVQTVYGSSQVSIVADPRTNSLFVQAIADELDRISDLIKIVDVPPAVKKEVESVKVFRLRTLDAVDAAATIENLTDVRISADPRTNTLVIQGTRQEVQEIEILLAKLGDNVRPRPASGLKVRVVWLVTGLEGLQKPPADLTHVSEEFAKLGVKDLKLAGQLIVNVNSAVGEKFSAQGTVTFDLSQKVFAMQEFSAQGVVKKLESKSADLEIDLKAQGKDGKSPVCQLKTTISAPIGHAVALGATPVDATVFGAAPGKPVTSVFVVQVLDK